MVNPYAFHLGSRNARKVVAETAGQLEALLESIGPARISTEPAPGKWSAREIACHLADCEIAFAFRIRQTLAEDGPVIQPFDQDKWAKNYQTLSAQAALAAFSALRAWNEALLALCWFSVKWRTGVPR